MIIPTNK